MKHQVSINIITLHDYVSWTYEYFISGLVIFIRFFNSVGDDY